MDNLIYIKSVSEDIARKVVEIGEDYYDGDLSAGMIYSSLLVYLSKNATNQNIINVSQIIEDSLNSNSEEVETAIKASFLEDLNIDQQKGIYQLMKTNFGPKTKIAMKEIEKFWTR